MRNYFPLLLLPLVLTAVLGAGCSTPPAPTVSDANNNNNNNNETAIVKNDKQSSWCRNPEGASAPKGVNLLWISSETFSGMNHAPTIRHVCQGNQELFFMQMEWNGDAKPHKGNLVAINSSSTKNFTSTKQDPDFELLETDAAHPNQIRVSIDDSIIIFDKNSKRFVE